MSNSSLRRLIERIAEIDKDDDEGKIKGFDNRTMRALTKVRAQYPNAPDDMAALLRHVVNVDNDSDDADESHTDRIKKLEEKVAELEKKLTLLLRKK